MSYQYPPQPVYYQMVRPPTNGAATASMVLGIVAICIGVWAFIPVLGLIASFFAAPCAIVGVALGHKGMTVSKVIGIGRSQANTGLALGYTTIGIIVLVTIIWNMASFLS